MLSFENDHFWPNLKLNIVYMENLRFSRFPGPLILPTGRQGRCGESGAVAAASPTSAGKAKFPDFQDFGKIAKIWDFQDFRTSYVILGTLGYVRSPKPLKSAKIHLF